MKKLCTQISMFTENGGLSVRCLKHLPLLDQALQQTLIGNKVESILHTIALMDVS